MNIFLSLTTCYLGVFVLLRKSKELLSQEAWTQCHFLGNAFVTHSISVYVSVCQMHIHSCDLFG